MRVKASARQGYLMPGIFPESDIDFHTLFASLIKGGNEDFLALLKEAGISHSTIRDWKTGRYIPSRRCIRKLLDSTERRDPLLSRQLLASYNHTLSMYGYPMIPV